MNDKHLSLSPDQGKAGVQSAPALPDANTQMLKLRQHHLERMARLFRHAGESADDRYLRDLMTRYRGLESS
jgi:hypothetical protein